MTDRIFFRLELDEEGPVIIGKYDSLLCLFLLDSGTLRWQDTCRGKHERGIYGDERDNLLEEKSNKDEWDDSADDVGKD